MTRRLIGGVHGDYKVAVFRRGERVIEIFARQITWDNGIEVRATLWEDGRVNVTVKEMGTGTVLHEWSNLLI